MTSNKFLTAFEYEVLFAIDQSEYGDEIHSRVWTFTIADHAPSIKGKQISGAVSSLVKKGYVTVCGDGEDQEIGMTEAGVKAYVHDTTQAGNTVRKEVRI